jgi:hypothetical protein
MLKDIDFKRVTDMAMAIVPEKMEDGIIWNTFLINMGENTMQSVLVNVRGYGEIENKTIKTSQMRYFFDEVAPKSFVKVEDLLDDLLPLNNEYWVSFSRNNYLFDKKYVFVPETITLENLVHVPVMNKEGVLII